MNVTGKIEYSVKGSVVLLRADGMRGRIRHVEEWMRKTAFGLFLLAAVLSGCDDSNMTGNVCNLECGHGTCYMQVTKERCRCDDGYSEDAAGPKRSDIIYRELK